MLDEKGFENFRIFMCTMSAALVGESVEITENGIDVYLRKRKKRQKVCTPMMPKFKSPSLVAMTPNLSRQVYASRGHRTPRHVTDPTGGAPIARLFLEGSRSISMTGKPSML